MSKEEDIKEENKIDDLAEIHQMDFEIKFFEGVLRKKQGFIDAMAALGDLYTKRGFFQKGLHIDKKLVKLKPRDSIVLYNLSCSYSLVEDLDHALKTIKLAIKFGYSDFQHLEQDADLKNLRHDQRFKNYYLQVRKKVASQGQQKIS